MRAASESHSKHPPELVGSMLQHKEMPKIPVKGIDKEVRKDALTLLRENPHLWSPEQVAPVSRLCSLRRMIRKAEAQLDASGMMIEQPNGMLVPNPLLKVIATLSSTTLSLERNLGIVFSSREKNVKKSELGAPPKGEAKRKPGRPRRDDSPVHLRLA